MRQCHASTTAFAGEPLCLLAGERQESQERPTKPVRG